MIQLVYVSYALDSFDSSELSQILARANINNLRHDVTGVLAYYRGMFIQLLEGKESTVENLYTVIAADKRHRNCERLLTNRIKKRSFSEWRMGFIGMDEIRSLFITDSQDIMKDNDFWNTNMCATTSMKLVRSFREQAMQDDLKACLESVTGLTCCL